MLKRPKVGSISGLSATGEGCLFGRVMYPPRGHFGPVDQGFYQIVGIVQGEMTVTADGRRHHVEAHHCCLLIPGQRVQINFSEHDYTEHNFGCLFAKWMPESLTRDFSSDQVVAPDSLQYKTLIELALETGAITFPGRDAQLQSLALSLFHEVHRLLMQPKGDSGHEAIARALAFLQAHYPEPIDAGAIARAAGLSRQHLTKLLRLHTGKSMVEHLWELRTEKARALLVDTGLQLGEIAERTGFQNPFHLSRKLKERYGATPRLLRARAWNRNQA